MYDLKQAVLLAYEQLSTHFQTRVFYKITGFMGMWPHPIKIMSFCLCADDFSLKYFSQQDVQGFLNRLGTNYKYTVDWSGRFFVA